jgi:FdhE protein
VTLKDWLARHPYLEPVARVHARIAAAADAVAIASIDAPDWNAYRQEFLDGMPLLDSSAAAIDLAPADAAIRETVDRLRLGDGAEPAGLVVCATALVFAKALRPLVSAFAEWRDDDRWLRRYCPTCGAMPSMAHLIGVDPGRRRMLVCGSCTTAWRYTRTQCPFCEADSQRLTGMAIEGEDGLRIDYCEACRGYLKTYAGHGNEDILLADWTSLHLDALARERGLERMAASLYDLEPQTV